MRHLVFAALALSLLSGCERQTAQSPIPQPTPWIVKESPEPKIITQPMIRPAVLRYEEPQETPPKAIMVTAEVERKEPVAQPAPPPAKQPWVALPSAVEMTEKGLSLVLEFEVGGRQQYERWPHPEYIGDEYSGVTWGIGYDGHQNSKAVILADWSPVIGEVNARRLADTQPYYGKAAKPAYEKVKDITITWEQALSVYEKVDVARVYSQCKRSFPDFTNYRDYARDAALSLVFNRGASMVGGARSEMRSIRDIGAKPSKDYEAMADQYRKMVRVWVGKSIYTGMKRRRYAEANLVVLREN